MIMYVKRVEIALLIIFFQEAKTWFFDKQMYV